MIVDVPASEDFEITGVGFLNLAWDSVLSLAIELDMAEGWAAEPLNTISKSCDVDEDGEAEEQLIEKYWKAAQHLGLRLTE